MNILYIEDNEGDRFLVRTILKQISPVHNVYAFPDGISALSFLDSIRTKAQPSFLDLILLDFGLPRMDGTEVLSRLKSDEYFRHIPVVGLSSSLPMWDEYRKLGAAAFIDKNVDVNEMEASLRKILEMIKVKPSNYEASPF